jgi:uncharacterized protein YjiS (DUF1127 family)
MKTRIDMRALFASLLSALRLAAGGRCHLHRLTQELLED